MSANLIKFLLKKAKVEEKYEIFENGFAYLIDNLKHYLRARCYIFEKHIEQKRGFRLGAPKRIAQLLQTKLTFRLRVRNYEIHFI